MYVLSDTSLELDWKRPSISLALISGNLCFKASAALSALMFRFLAGKATKFTFLRSKFGSKKVVDFGD